MCKWAAGAGLAVKTEPGLPSEREGASRLLCLLQKCGEAARSEKQTAFAAMLQVRRCLVCEGDMPSWAVDGG